MFCSECGQKISLAGVGEVITMGRVALDQIDQGQGTPDMRTQYESALVVVKSLARKKERKEPTCFISYAMGEQKHDRWVEKKLARDLQNAGIKVILDRWHNAAAGSSNARFISLIGDPETLIVVVGTPLYLQKYENKVSMTGSVAAAEVDLIHQRYIGIDERKATVLPVLLDGSEGTSIPPIMRGRVYADFRREEHYFSTLFDLILTLFGIPFDSMAVADLSESLIPRNDLR